MLIGLMTIRVTCPKKTDPTIELALGSKGSRFNGKKTYFSRTDHDEAKGGRSSAQPGPDGETGLSGG